MSKNKNSFILYAEYAEQIDLLTLEERGVLMTAIFNYQNGKELPEMDGAVRMCFAFIKQQFNRDNERYDDICKARSEAGRSSAEKRKQKATNATSVEIVEQKATNATDNEDDNEDDNYPPISPQGGAAEERNGDKEKFFSLYPKLKSSKKYDDSAVDYKVLLDMFSVSKHLRGTYSMKWICENYEAIRNGVFSDEESVSEQRAERERYYARRRQKAETEAEKAREAFEKEHPEYAEISRDLGTLERESAKAEVFAPATLPELTKRAQAKRREKAAFLRRFGLTEEAFQPKYQCKKCSDTGFLPDGRACNCYGK